MFLSRGFFGGRVGEVRITNRTVTASNTDLSSPYLASASAGVRMRSDGGLDRVAVEGGPAVYTPVVGEWLVSGAPADFEVLAEVTGDPLFVGTTGAWLPLSSAREWLVNAQRTSLGTTVRSTSLVLTLREALSGVVVAAATFSLVATATCDV